MGKNEVMPKRYLIIGIITMSTLLFMSVFSIGTIYFGMCAVKETSEQVSELEAQLNQVNEQIVQIETEKQTIKRLEQKTAFLTFDDGPSPKTLAILEILQKYQVQATFYVTGHMVEKYPEIMQQLVDSGQKIAAHSYSHRYSEIYESLATFQADFIKNNEVIKQYTGKDVTLFRHPGGSSATAGAPGVVQTTLYWLDDMGVNYTDWNVDSMDASSQEVA
ncbi:MAG: polysaccharide deacetylase family protein, partial [Culicoidibacterales bacterium]